MAHMSELSLAAPPGPNSTFTDRCWWAYNCLDPGPTGRLPSYRSLETEHGLPLAVLSKLFRRTIASVDAETLPKLAAALRTSPEWLTSGSGDAPTARGPIPALPGPRLTMRTYLAPDATSADVLLAERDRANKAADTLDLTLIAAVCFAHDHPAVNRGNHERLWSGILSRANDLPGFMVIRALELRDKPSVAREDALDLARAVIAWAHTVLVQVSEPVGVEPRLT